MSHKNEQKTSNEAELRSVVIQLQREISRMRESFLMIGLFLQEKGIGKLEELLEFGQKHFAKNFDLAGQVAINVYNVPEKEEIKA
jgi:hypothetical protein